MQRTLSRFEFKQFHIEHGNGVWKVGTDSVLLGSWCRVNGAIRALDMGTGSGILALMLAQRNAGLLIDALDVLPESIALARENVLQSPWLKRISVRELDLLEPDQVSSGSYDLVICNPPYFPFGPAAYEDTRRAARQGIGFTLWDVASIASQFLTPEGSLHVVIPVQSQYHFIEKANTYKLYVHQWTDERKITLAQFVLINDDAHSLIRQVKEIDATLRYIAGLATG